MSNRDKKVGLVLLGFAGACVGLTLYRQSQAGAEEERSAERGGQEHPSPELRARIDRHPAEFFRREMTPAEFHAFVEGPRVPIILASGLDGEGDKHYLLGDWETGSYAHTVGDQLAPLRDAPAFLRDALRGGESRR